MRILAIFFITIFYQMAIADVEWHFKQLNIGEGLSGVRCIFRDSDGYLWIGNDGPGLMRFDGYQTQRFLHSPDDSSSISSDRILKIYQDTHDRLWICTRNGLNIYQPHSESFIHYLPNSNNSTSISSQIIYCIHEDSKGRIWLGTANGLNRYNESSNSFTHYQFVNNSTQANKIHSVTETPDGNLWISTELPGLIHFNSSNTITNYYPNPLQDQNHMTSKIHLGCDSLVWIATTGDGIFCYNPDNNTFTKFPINRDGSGISGSMVMDIFEEDSRYIYFAVDQGGINQLDRQTNTFTYFDQNTATRTSSNGTLNIYKDYENIIWIGTSRGGVNFYNPNTPKFKSYHKYNNAVNRVNELADNIVGCFFEDQKGQIWIGTDGNGISLYNKANGQFQNYRNTPGQKRSLPSNVIRSIAEDNQGMIWIATWENGIRRLVDQHFLSSDSNSDALRSLSDKNCWTLFIDSKNRIWTSYEDGKIYMYDTAFKQFMDLTFHINKEYNSTPYFYEFSNKGIFLSNQTGVYHFNEETSQMQQIIKEDDINYVSIDTDNNYWIGTSKNGILVFDSFYQYKTKIDQNSGLLDNYISGILCSNDSNIWISTANGLYCYHTKLQQLFSYFKEDGIQGNQFFLQAAMKTRSGELYFGGTEGFTYFNPKDIVFNMDQLNVIINNIYVDNNPLDYKGHNKSLTSHPRFINNIKLNYKHSVLGIEFNAITFNSPENIKYKYRLTGFNSNWTETIASNRIATFTNLDPGDYIFEVKASNRDGLWSDKITRITITIPPPFYLSLWFVILIIFSGLVTIRIYIYLREKRLIKDRSLLREAVAERTKIIEDQKEELLIQNEELQRHRLDLESIVDERTIELIKAKEKAEEANKLKTSFLANMSHEIRTPMNAIVGFSNLIAEPTLSTVEREQFANLIRINSDNLLVLIEDILDISRIEANQLQIIKHPFFLNELITSLFQTFELQINRDDLELILNNIVEDKNLIINTDQHRIKQILSNLLSNALKFTDKGYVRLSAQLSTEHLILSVEDTGQGLTSKQIDIIFNPFIKLARDEKRLKRGVGLGLAITKQLAVLMGYQIKVDSVVGKGSTFSLYIPIHEINNETISDM